VDYRQLQEQTTEDGVTTATLKARDGLKQSVHDKIEATLLHISLESCPEYEALSYRWGADNDSEKIFVEGLSVKISRTLKRALQERQSSTKTKLVWVDALCIDQANDQERNEQVTKMRNIYSKAANVVV
jgi:hypothetical protein